MHGRLDDIYGPKKKLPGSRAMVRWRTSGDGSGGRGARVARLSRVKDAYKGELFAGKERPAMLLLRCSETEWEKKGGAKQSREEFILLRTHCFAAFVLVCLWRDEKNRNEMVLYSLSCSSNPIHLSICKSSEMTLAMNE
jgi:hypothetical protein